MDPIILALIKNNPHELWGRFHRSQIRAAVLKDLEAMGLDEDVSMMGLNSLIRLWRDKRNDYFGKY